ncbi:MAG: polysaccharide biosynthesis protein [Bacteroidales bacterium]|nr:polysaccharide biosynthesis protein [Bacteroidales bacterium]MCF8396660.1 polysaccharide biosynthesis protein [Bacteroidales bacterium]
MLIDRQNMPRWLIITIDVVIVFFAVILAYLIRFNFEIPDYELKPLPWILLIMLSVRLISFLIGKTHFGILRYTSTQDIVRLIIVMIIGSVIFVSVDIVTYFFFGNIFFIPFSIIIIEFLLSFFGAAAVRLIAKVTYLELSGPSGRRSKVIIFGAGEAGILTKRVLERDAGSKLKVLAFLDDDPRKAGKKLEGTEIIPTGNLDGLLAKNHVEQVIISVQNLKQSRKQEIIESCIRYDVKVMNVPPIVQWINGELSFNQIKKINIEDLLGREVIKLEEKSLHRELNGKTVLITGASGSIGSELFRQLARFKPGKLLLLDQSETPLFHLELECLEKFPDLNYEIIVADICNEMRMRKVFNTFNPEIIYHAAAYKHVPMMENNPTEAIHTNVEGTRILADLAVEFGLKKFIMISTDKAVKPTNVMGASKRIAEIYVQSLSNGKTSFITTRFGNVLGSNGSVIPLFRQQIENGGPVTITHPEITRYFMTIPEACQLVLEAGAMGKGGEIYIFDMGDSVKIVDLARKMIKLSGLELGKDIQIKYIGLRPGEKLYEELLNDKENTLPTHHPQIMIARVEEYERKYVEKVINELIALYLKQDNFKIVKRMKEILPEFKSKNSVYEQLDAAEDVENT